MEHFHNSGSWKLQNFYLVPHFTFGKVDPNFRRQSEEGVDLPQKVDIFKNYEELIGKVILGIIVVPAGKKEFVDGNICDQKLV